MRHCPLMPGRESVFGHCHLRPRPFQDRMRSVRPARHFLRYRTKRYSDPACSREVVPLSLLQWRHKEDNRALSDTPGSTVSHCRSARGRPMALSQTVAHSCTALQASSIWISNLNYGSVRELRCAGAFARTSELFREFRDRCVITSATTCCSSTFLGSPGSIFFQISLPNIQAMANARASIVPSVMVMRSGGNDFLSGTFAASRTLTNGISFTSSILATSYCWVRSS